MLKHLYFLLFTISITSIISSCKNNNTTVFRAPDGKQKGLLVLNSRACYFADADSIEKQTQIKIDTPSCREIEQIQSIMVYAGLPQNFKIYRGNIDNALATVVNNQRLIIYNKDLFSALDELNSSYWSSLFIIAHEIGHHLANNISDTTNILQAELDADKFAGFILYRMGADSNQVINAVASSLISTTHDTKSHPAKDTRIEAIKSSWNEAFNLRYLSAVPPPVYDHFTEAAGTEFEKFSAGFSEEYLIFNNRFLSQWDLERIDYYDVDYFNLDTSYLRHLKSATIRLNGIITDVQKMPVNIAYKNVKQLTIEVLVTQLDTIDFPDILINQKHRFSVAYQPLFSYDKENNFYDFFVGGRRIDFNIYNFNMDGNNSYYISRAYAIKHASL